MTETDWIDDTLHEHTKIIGYGFIIEYVLYPECRIRLQ